MVRDTHAFISVHSGTRAILHPYAYAKKPCLDSTVGEVAHKVASEFCPECLVGGAAEKIGYISYGSS
jgi:hypothetical protein